VVLLKDFVKLKALKNESTASSQSEVCNRTAIQWEVHYKLSPQETVQLGDELSFTVKSMLCSTLQQKLSHGQENTRALGLSQLCT
jgi:hypothetical protein